MNTIIEKIRAEVLRLIRESDGPGSPYGFGRMSACNRILNFLDTIQEQPVCEGLEEETEKFIETFGWGKTKHLAEKELISATARHFYELGCRRTAEKYDEIEYKRQRAEESVPSDLKDASEKEYPCDKSWMTETMLDLNAHCQVAFWKGAKWQREQMLKEAVETWMLEGSMFEPEFFKRKVIIIKED